MTEHARVVVIGGGAVGCSCLYHLARLGWTDALLLEQDELTSGSTWHAAGNCPTFSTSWGVLKLQKYSSELYRGLAGTVGYPVDYHVTGSVRLSHTRERMDEFLCVQDIAGANGLDYAILTTAELKDRYPFVELDDLNGALWDPHDGDIDPAQLTQALAKGARDQGACIRRFTRVTAIARAAGGWRITTVQGDILAEAVVNAAGYRAGEIMALLGERLPTVTLAHHYLVTEDVPELAGRPRLPLLRDPDVSYYLRQERGGLLLGPYEWQASAMWRDGIPDDFSRQLFPDDLSRLEPIIAAACARVPPLARAGIRRVVNGPIPYAPDGLPYIGPAHGLENFFHCNTFSFGITQAGGAGKALAEWVVEGGPEWDHWSVDPRRHTGYATKTFTAAKAVETYQNEYAPAFPFEERPAGRPLRCSPLYGTLQARGAQFGARGGWERAAWFGEAARTLSFRRDRAWFAAVREEVRAVRERVGVLDLPGFTKNMVSGPGAAAWLDRLLCSRLPAAGRVGLAYALDQRGRIVSEFTVTRLAADRFYLASAAAAEWHDADLLDSAPQDGSVRVEELTGRLGTLVLAGPRARAVLSRITRDDLSNARFPWRSAQDIEIGAARPLALRINYLGELGWELHAPVEDLSGLYQAIREAGEPDGLRDIGIYAVECLRLEKCYRAWKVDLETGYSPLQASLDRFVDFAKPDFTGRAALLQERRRGPSHRLVPLVLDEAGDADAPPCASVFSGGERVGLVTSGGWSFTLGRSIALAYVRAGLAHPDTPLAVQILGQPRGARVSREPLYDLQNARLRG